MRFIKKSLFALFASLALASCGENVVDNYIVQETSGNIGVNIVDSDYELNTYHKSYFNPLYTDSRSLMYDHNYGFSVFLKLDDPSKLDMINRLTMRTVDYNFGRDTIAFEFDKYRLHEMFDQTLGGFKIKIDSLYIRGREYSYYPFAEYSWNITLYNSEGLASNPYVMGMKAECYMYGDYCSSIWMTPAILKINFEEPVYLNTSRLVKLFFFDRQKKYIADYPELDINKKNPSVSLENVPEGAAYYRIEISEVYYGIKRTYIGRFETVPARP